MSNPYTHDKIDNWVSDFCLSDQLCPFPADLRDMADAILRRMMYAACDIRDTEPDDLEENDIKEALLNTIAKLNIPAELHPHVPALCGALLTYLETEGRIGGGRVMGAYAKALTDSYLQAATGKTKPIVNPGSKIGRNDPCPCGSGKKYKKCCGKDS